MFGGSAARARPLGVTGQLISMTTDAARTAIELGVALLAVVLLVRYEYLRRVTGKQTVITGLLAAVMVVLFIGLVVLRVSGFLAF